MRRLGLLAVLVVLASPSSAVGLGPLAMEGVTATAQKGFYLTLINPFPQSVRYHLYGVGWSDEVPEARIRIPTATATLGPMSQRRMLVIVTNLQRNEIHRFRVCAERARTSKEEIIHARVCSRLVAHRIG